MVYIITVGRSLFVTTWTPSTGKSFTCTLIRHSRKKFYCDLRKRLLNPLVGFQVFTRSFLLRCLLLVWRGMRWCHSTDPAGLGISTLVNSRPESQDLDPSSENSCFRHGNAQATFSASVLL